MPRLIFALLCLALACLAVIPAPTHLAWELSILVKEWGYVLAFIVLIVVLPGWRAGTLGRVAGACAILAALLALSPLVRAAQLARALPAQLQSAFGIQEAVDSPDPLTRATPLSMLDLVRGVHSPRVNVSTLTYAQRADGDMHLDLYRPVGQTGPFPLVLMIHGGSWQGGDRAQLAPLNRYLAARGYAVAAISYRFAPAHPFPAPLEDVHDALSYLRGNAQSLELDAQRIVFIGRSAGAQLALVAAYTAHDAAVRGVVSFYGPTDLVWGYDNPSPKLVMDSKGMLSDYLSGTPQSAAASYTAASPLHFIDSTAPQTLIVHGTRDELVSIVHSRRLDKALAAANVRHLLIELPWATHGCDYAFNGPCGQISTYAIERFLAHVMQ